MPDFMSQLPRLVSLVSVTALLCSCLGQEPVTVSRPVSAAPSQARSVPSSGSTTSAEGRPSRTASPVNIYARAGAGMLSTNARAAKSLVYVPNALADTMQVIDPRTFRVIATYRTGAEPQHVVPSWDMKTLWVNDDIGNDLVPVDPRTGKPGRRVHVEDPYNLYFTPDGAHALVMAERLRRIDVRNPATMALEHSLAVPCHGVNHADYSADLSFFVASCEFSGRLLVIDRNATRVIKVISLNSLGTAGATSVRDARAMGGARSNLMPGASAMPQDVRLTPDGTRFLVADMMRNGVWVVSARTRKVERFIGTGMGAHGIYPDRAGRRIFVTNRGEGSVSVLAAASLRVTAKWRIPGGGSPDMGGVSADGSQLWLSGRYDSEVYVISTKNGTLIKRIKVNPGPHGLLVWPQPGRFSLGHTGNTR